MCRVRLLLLILVAKELVGRSRICIPRVNQRVILKADLIYLNIDYGLRAAIFSKLVGFEIKNGFPEQYFCLIFKCLVKICEVHKLLLHKKIQKNSIVNSQTLQNIRLLL
jgi:hypothetical protein